MELDSQKTAKTDDRIPETVHTIWEQQVGAGKYVYYEDGKSVAQSITDTLGLKYNQANFDAAFEQFPGHEPCEGIISEQMMVTIQ